MAAKRDAREAGPPWQPATTPKIAMHTGKPERVMARPS